MASLIAEYERPEFGHFPNVLLERLIESFMGKAAKANTIVRRDKTLARLMQFDFSSDEEMETFATRIEAHSPSSPRVIVHRDRQLDVYQVTIQEQVTVERCYRVVTDDPENAEDMCRDGHVLPQTESVSTPASDPHRQCGPTLTVERLELRPNTINPSYLPNLSELFEQERDA